MKKHIIPGLIAAALVITAVGLFADRTNAQASYCLSGQSCTPLFGWAYSSNVGWISFNSENTNSAGGSYRVNVSTSTANPTIGTFSGYAWSSNVGWISFNSADVTGCPSDGSSGALNGCVPTVNVATGQVSGWARVLSMVGEEGDGWLQFAGTNHSSGSGGISFDPATGNFGGFAWESSAIGWLAFDASSLVGSGCVGPECTVCLDCGPIGGGGSNLSLNGQYLLYNGKEITGDNAIRLSAGEVAVVGLSWDISGLSDCDTTGTGPWGRVSNTSSITANTPGTGNITFTDSDVGQNYNFGVSCVDESAFPETDVEDHVNISIVAGPPEQPPVCGVPANATACPFMDSSTGPAQINPSCQSTEEAPLICEYMCSPGYMIRNGVCSRSSVTPF